ncbi:hypothetical protein BMS3Bbin06_01931 [bacterium BMS3Bbin06]|nr:hypothetical protein BMS3Abin08_01765 [bacterium BMS3Abin08]GBE35391.1 hypothetical protein BMS3Bbin06_01931 [bacterium BMS3Bbin06]
MMNNKNNFSSMQFQMEKLNCWEFKKCGREPGGSRVVELGVCPAPINTSMNDINGGINGGRICWLIAGTYGKYKVEHADCTAVQDILSCYDCEFHRIVLNEEGYEFAD